MPSEAAARVRMPPFHIYRDFLAPEDNAALAAWAIAHEEYFAPSRLFGDVYNADRRSSTSLASTVEKSWRKKIEARVDALAPTLFANAGVAPFDIVKELEMVAYNDTARFKPHLDVQTGASRHERRDRILSGVYYFHREPKRFSGGALRLFGFGAEGVAVHGGEDSSTFVDIPPEQNSFVLFPSWVRHEVREVSCPSKQFADSRFAVNCWLCRTRETAS